MSHSQNSRRDFLNKLSLLAASGGAAAILPQLRMMNTALASTRPSALSGYKALVCVYLSGGNDSWNMLVPFDSNGSNLRFDVYAASRGGVYDPATNGGGLGLTLPTGSNIALQKIIDGNDASSATNQYFLHPSFTTPYLTQTPLSTLYTQGHLAFAVNVGTLVKPIMMSDYNSSPANRPPQLFSHSDQTSQWHQGNTSTATAVGWGGLCAENLQVQGANLTTNPALALAISLAGANRFEVGASSVPYQMSSNGLNALSGVCNPTCTGGASNSSARDAALNSLLGETYANDFSGEYNTVLQRARDLYTKIGPNLPPNSTTYVPSTAFPSNNSLASQLKTVATMIKLSKAQGYASRQIYFVQLGGFDLHSGLMSGGGNHATLLTQVAQALGAFYTSLGPTDVNAQNEVTAFTMSDFARTLQSNGSGSDHGWGGLQMVLGGAVHGGKLYSNGGGPISGFPNQSLGGTGSPAPNNFSRGQMIPGIGVEQYAATLAQWMGVSATDCNTIFPNLTNFTSKNLGFV